MTGQHLSTDERRIAVRLIVEEGMTYAFVARVLRCHKSTLSRMIERFRTTGEIEEVHSGGPRPHFREAELETLRHLIEQHRNYTAAGLCGILPSSAPHISERTVQRYRRLLDMTPRRGRITSRRIGRYAVKRWQ